MMTKSNDKSAAALLKPALNELRAKDFLVPFIPRPRGKDGRFFPIAEETEETQKR